MGRDACLFIRVFEFITGQLPTLILYIINFLLIMMPPEIVVWTLFFSCQEFEPFVYPEIFS